jgi:hypothetical protein
MMLHGACAKEGLRDFNEQVVHAQPRSNLVFLVIESEPFPWPIAL